MFMRIKKFRNKNGMVKLVYRKKYFLFGKRYWFVISRGIGCTYTYYDSVDEASGVYNVIKHLLEDRRWT